MVASGSNAFADVDLAWRTAHQPPHLHQPKNSDRPAAPAPSAPHQLAASSRAPPDTGQTHRTSAWTYPHYTAARRREQQEFCAGRLHSLISRFDGAFRQATTAAPGAASEHKRAPRLAGENETILFRRLPVTLDLAATTDSPAEDCRGRKSPHMPVKNLFIQPFVSPSSAPGIIPRHRPGTAAQTIAPAGKSSGGADRSTRPR